HQLKNAAAVGQGAKRGVATVYHAEEVSRFRQEHLVALARERLRVPRAAFSLERPDMVRLVVPLDRPGVAGYLDGTLVRPRVEIEMDADPGARGQRQAHVDVVVRVDLERTELLDRRAQVRRPFE